MVQQINQDMQPGKNIVQYVKHFFLTRIIKFYAAYAVKQN